MRTVLAALLAASPGVAWADLGPYAVSAFGGTTLDNTWDDVFLSPGAIEFTDSNLAGAAVSARVAAPLDGLSFEIEGQIVRHFGGQTHWEVNAPVAVARWSRFPWNETLRSSAAFGLGLSMASETPAQEVENEGDSRQVMAYWMIEVELAAPESPWSVIGRLHHRSTAYGVFGEDGGSNALVMGLRRRF